MNPVSFIPSVLMAWLMLAADASAWVVRYRPAQELQRQAKIVLVATVLAKHMRGQSVMGEFYTYKIKVHRVQRGKFTATAARVSYYNQRAVLRDGVMTCPLKNGSGLETDLAVGLEIRFFLDNSANQEILFAEHVEKQKH